MADLLVGISDPFEVKREILSRINDDYLQPEFSTDYPDRLRQVRVIGNDQGNIVRPLEAIEKQMAGEVDVRSLLLSLDDVGHFERVERYGSFDLGISEGPILGIGRKSPVVDREVGDRFQRPNIDLLARAVIRIVGSRVHQSREVVNVVDQIPGEQFGTQLVEVEPSVVAPMGPANSVL